MWLQPHFKGSAATVAGGYIGQRRLMDACKHNRITEFAAARGNQETPCGRRYWHWISKGEQNSDIWGWEGLHLCSTDGETEAQRTVSKSYKEKVSREKV